MTQTRPSPLVMAALLTLHGVVTALVWRDIGRRPTAQLRGGRSLWRTLTALNTGNSLAYVLIGVRRHR